MGSLKSLAPKIRPVTAPPIDQILTRLAQQCVQAAPVIVLGSGASVPYGLPTMTDLASQLSVSSPITNDSNHLELWQIFIQKLESIDLESALTDTVMPDILNRHVVEVVWDYISKADFAAFSNIIQNRQSLVLTRLLRHILSSTHMEVDIVTTNYDRLAEYAADAGELCHSTGFSHGHIRFWRPERPLKFLQERKPARCVNIWKVHGSLDWFEDASRMAPIGLPLMQTRLPGHMPLIVTPGIEKFQRTHDEPFRTILRVCLESHAERATRRSRMMAEAAYRKALAEAMVASKSLARRRFRPIQAKKRSTTQRRA